MLVAETEDGKDDGNMDEKDKKIAELEAKMMLAEQQSENDEENAQKGRRAGRGKAAARTGRGLAGRRQ